MVPANSGAAWAPQLADLNRLIAEGRTVRFMAEELGRSTHSIDCKLEAIGKKERYKAYRPTTKEIKEIKDMSTSKSRKVTIRTFVGEIEATNLSVDDLIEAIEQEESFVARIGNLKLISPKIKGLMAAHQANITALLELLEG